MTWLHNIETIIYASKLSKDTMVVMAMFAPPTIKV